MKKRTKKPLCKACFEEETSKMTIKAMREHTCEEFRTCLKATDRAIKDSRAMGYPCVYTDDEAYFIDPMFWQCLGKAYGWSGSLHHLGKGSLTYTRWIGLINALADGLTIERYLLSIQ